MKKIILFILTIVLIIIMPAEAFAETASPSPSEPVSTPSASQSQSPSPSASAGFKVIKIDSSGSEVSLIQLRLRDLGYLFYRPTGVYGTLTRAAAIRFQEKNELSPDGEIGEFTFKKLFFKNLKRASLASGVKITTGPSDNKKSKVYGNADDWTSVVSLVYAKGVSAVITDLYSGTTFNMTRTGGTNHAEVETDTNADYKKFLKAFGGATSFEKRAVTVTIGEKVFAASLFGWPHDYDSIPNNGMEGHACLYFKGSVSDVMGLPDIEHDEMVEKAANAAI